MGYRHINPDYIESVAGDDISVLDEIIGMFKDQVKEMIAEMRKLLESGNNYGLGMLAHKAKSSVAIMGMADLAAMLKTFELQAKESKETNLYKGYIERFSSDTEEAVKELDDYLFNLKKG